MCSVIFILYTFRLITCHSTRSQNGHIMFIFRNLPFFQKPFRQLLRNFVYINCIQRDAFGPVLSVTLKIGPWPTLSSIKSSFPLFQFIWAPFEWPVWNLVETNIVQNDTCGPVLRTSLSDCSMLKIIMFLSPVYLPLRHNRSMWSRCVKIVFAVCMINVCG